jgi:hypothetical protein
LIGPLAWALAGCPPGAGGAPDADVDWGDAVPGGAAELGTGTVDFEPLDPFEELDLVQGPQGGFHFIVHARIRDMIPGDADDPDPSENPWTRFSAFRADGVQIDSRFPAVRVGYDDDGDPDGWFTLRSGRLLVIDNAEVPAIYGTQVRIVLAVRDVDGKVATDERWVIARAADDESSP